MTSPCNKRQQDWRTPGSEILSITFEMLVLLEAKHCFVCSVSGLEFSLQITQQHGECGVWRDGNGEQCSGVALQAVCNKFTGGQPLLSSNK